MTGLKTVKKTLILGGGLFLLVLLGLAWVFAPVNHDAGYYLALAERVSEGEVLYRDYACGYTPLMIWLLAAVKDLFGDATSYGHYLGMVLLLHLLNAGGLAYLGWRLSGKLRPGLWVGLGSLSLWLAYEGTYMLLEPLMISFSLLALGVLCLGKAGPIRFFLTGSCIGLAFLSKQFGAALLLPLLYAACVKAGSWRQRLLKLVAGSIGFVLPILVLILIYSLRYGVRPDTLLQQWLVHPAYGQHDWISSLWAWLAYLLLNGVFLLLWVTRRNWHRSAQLTALALVAASLPLYWQQFPHYFLWLSSFLPLWGLLLHQALPDRGLLRRGFGVLLFLTCLGLGLRLGVDGYEWYQVRQLRAHQYTRAEALQALLPPHTAVLLLSNEQNLKYLCSLQPAHAAWAGYTFPKNFSKDETRRLLSATNWAITDSTGLAQVPWHLDLLQEAAFVPVDSTDWDKLWRKRKS